MAVKKHTKKRKDTPSKKIPAGRKGTKKNIHIVSRVGIHVNGKQSGKQNGGKKLGEGGFGCVIHPGISCGPGSSANDPHQARRTISKIIPDSRQEQYKQELAIYHRIKKIDPEQRYLISFNEECALDPNVIDSRQPKDILRVKFYDDNHDEYSIMENPDVVRRLGLDTYNEDDIEDEFCRVDSQKLPRNLVQVYGGKRLNQVLKAGSSSRADSHIAFQFKLIKENGLQVIRDLLYGIYLLHSNTMVHRDIKYSNIVVIISRLASSSSAKYPLTRHIDFGLSQDISNMPSSLEAVSWQGTADRIPIEIYMLYMMANIKYNYPKMSFNDQQARSVIIRRTMNKYRKKARKYYRSLHLDKSYLGSQLAYIDSITSNTQGQKNNAGKNHRATLDRDKNEYITIDDMHKLYDKFVEEYKKDILGRKYTTKYTGYVYKTDIFAMGLLIKDMASKLGYSKHLKPLISRMCAVDPDKRPVINDCIHYLDAILEPMPEVSQ